VYRMFKIVTGMLFGAMLAGALVLLFAPRSGAEMREAIQERIDAILSAGQQAAETRRLELTERLQELKQPAGQR
jgi:gas vesicle protein